MPCLLPFPMLQAISMLRDDPLGAGCFDHTPHIASTFDDLTIYPTNKKYHFFFEILNLTYQNHVFEMTHSSLICGVVLTTILQILRMMMAHIKMILLSRYEHFLWFGCCWQVPHCSRWLHVSLHAALQKKHPTISPQNSSHASRKQCKQWKWWTIMKRT